MTPTHCLILAAFPAVLAGCAAAPAVLSGLGSAGSAYVAVDKITEAASPYIAKGCTEYQAAKAAADAVAARGLLPATANTSLTSIESYGDAACAKPPAGDPLSTDTPPRHSSFARCTTNRCRRTHAFSTRRPWARSR